jgi:hypothetical protein
MSESFPGMNDDVFGRELANASWIGTPTRADLARVDRKHKKKGSNDDWSQLPTTGSGSHAPFLKRIPATGRDKEKKQKGWGDCWTWTAGCRLETNALVASRPAGCGDRT